MGTVVQFSGFLYVQYVVMRTKIYSTISTHSVCTEIIRNYSLQKEMNCSYMSVPDVVAVQ